MSVKIQHLFITQTRKPSPDDGFDIKVRFLAKVEAVKRDGSAFGMHADFNITCNSLHVMMPN